MDMVGHDHPSMCAAQALVVNHLELGNDMLRSIRLDKFSHDRNVETIVEQESPRVTAPGTNAVPSTSQQLGALADAEDEGDENLRLGFTVQGVINEKSDIDVRAAVRSNNSRVTAAFDLILVKNGL